MNSSEERTGRPPDRSRMMFLTWPLACTLLGAKSGMRISTSYTVSSAMEKIELRDTVGVRIGWIETDAKGLQTARGAVGVMGKKLGTYDPREDTTRDAIGKRYSKGNMLGALIALADTRKK